MCEKICFLMDALIDATVDDIENKKASLDIHEMGEIIDMIKDLAEARYYAHMCEAGSKTASDK